MVGNRRVKAVKAKEKPKKTVKKPKTPSSPPKAVKAKEKPIVNKETEKKIKQRAKAAWNAPLLHHHRISDITDDTITYRLPSEEGQPPYSGMKILVKKGKRGGITITKK